MIVIGLNSVAPASKSDQRPDLFDGTPPQSERGELRCAPRALPPPRIPANIPAPKVEATAQKPDRRNDRPAAISMAPLHLSISSRTPRVTAGSRFARATSNSSMPSSHLLGAELVQLPASMRRRPGPATPQTRLPRRLLHKPIRNPVHQLVAGITRAADTHLHEKLGERVDAGQLLATFSHHH